MSPQPVFLDANVLVPVSFADMLLSLAERGVLSPFWSEHVMTAALSAAKHRRPDLPPASVERRFAAMRRSFPAAMVDCADLDPANYPSPDPEDRLIIGAAHRSPADVIVTRNISDFPAPTLERYGLSAMTPDSLLLKLLTTHQSAVVSVLHDITAALRNPPLSLDGVLANLGTAGAPGFAAAVSKLKP
ncbi:MAG: PIN domain-containing protein [Propionibacteriaceae bacterium]|nr:PIN domain-containing protein [Propionibacteriaceae bacterium]